MKFGSLNSGREGWPISLPEILNAPLAIAKRSDDEIGLSYLQRAEQAATTRRAGTPPAVSRRLPWQPK